MLKESVRYLTLASISLVFFNTSPLIAAEPSTKAILYNRDVRPILAENCFACHGPDSAARKANLRLDRSEDALASNALVPGNPGKSEALARVLLPESDEGHMPPGKSHKKLTAAQKETLKLWISQGAAYQPHWSFIPPVRPPVPGVKTSSPIDAFLREELKEAGLTMNAEADRRTLARRAAFDMTGLPPEPSDVEAFVADPSPQAYEKYLDQLLVSPHWGEHRGRYWLDAARYGDTHGIHFDNYREMWSYREWVIEAFNNNIPFDQFTIEQLAGDLLPNPTLEQKVATGFVRCNITTNEGGAISEEYLVLYARDRTETFGQVWLGLTAGCAVCHDHKFDPLSTKDFYSLTAFFNNTPQAGMDGNIPNTPPVIPVPRKEDRAAWNALQTRIAASKAEVQARRTAARKDFSTWAKTAKADGVTERVPADKLDFHAKLTEGTGNEIAVSQKGKAEKVNLSDGFAWVPGKGEAKGFAIKPGKVLSFADAGNFDREQPFTVAAWVNRGRMENGTLVGRMDNSLRDRGWDLAVEQDRIAFHHVFAWPSDAISVTMKTQLKNKEWNHILVSYDGSSKSAGVKFYLNGQPQPVEIGNDTLTRSPLTPVPLTIGQRATNQRVQGIALQDLRIYSRALAPGEADQVALAPRAAEVLLKPADKRTPAESNELFDWWLATFDKQYRELDGKFSALEAEEIVLKSRGTVAHVAVEREGEATAYTLFRGEYDQRRDQVKAATPKSLPELPAELPRNRLGLAKWLTRPDHPLMARVTVNRFWLEVFGNGLVRTAGDFGITGDQPSHPKLLDWLAIEFRESGWDVKKFFKLMLMSQAYRQSAQVTPEKREKDPENRLLSRGPRFRMDAEMLRDTALASSGLLVRKLGGPSVKPYQPEGVWEAVAMIGSNTRNYKADAGENLYRRSMYTFWKRAAPPAAMEVLNAPNRETCTVRRERTNTPLQALLTLNDVQFVEAARGLAEKTLKEGGTSDADRLDFLARRVVARPFRSEEKVIVSASLGELRKDFHAKPEEAKKLITFGESKPDAKLDVVELAAWTMLANEIMNLDEALCK